MNDTDPREGEGRGRSAEEIYAQYCRRVMDGEDLSLDDICEEFPSLAHALRLLDEADEGEVPSAGDSFESKLAAALSGDPVASDQPVGGLGADALASKTDFEVAGGRRFRVLGELGRGGMSVVLEVEDPELDRSLALKVLCPGTGRPIGSDPGADGARLRFLREAKVVARLDHPGVLPIHTLARDVEGHLFFTMPRVQGMDLGSAFRCARKGLEGWTLTRAILILVQVCRTVAHAHSRGVIHRDLKPSNVMVGDYDEAYVMDWGLAGIEPGAAKAAEENDSLQPGSGEPPGDDPLETLPGTILGTPAYVSPEQAAGLTDGVDERSDVYSVGATLYELLTGLPPHVSPDGENSPETILKRISEGPPAPVSSAAPNAPTSLCAICEKAMERRADDRYATMVELAGDLQAFVEDRVVRAHRTGALAELGTWVRRNRPAALAIALAVFCFILTLGTVSVIERRARGRESQALELEKTARKAAVQAREAIEASQSEILRLSDSRRLQVLLEEFRLGRFEAQKNPAVLADWIRNAEKLLEHLPVHRETLGRLQERGREAAVSPRGPFPALHPCSQLRQELMGLKARVRRHLFLLQKRLVPALIRQWPGAPPGFSLPNPLVHEARMATVRARLRRLNGRSAAALMAIQDTGVRVLATEEEQWFHDSLASLVARLELLDAAVPVQGTLSRVRQVHRCLAESLSGHPEAWEAALAAIPDESRCPLYGGMPFVIQPGLVPLGPDPDSELWEFGHLRSGALPRRGADGQLQIDEGSCIVFVLLPGLKTFAQASGTDPRQTAGPAPGRAGIPPFLLSKYEMTQGQWLRLTGENPSHFGPESLIGETQHTLLHPVEGVSAEEVHEVLERHGLRLPMAAQWEYAAGAGLKVDWPCGDSQDPLAVHANLRDSSCKALGGVGSTDHDEWIEDGYLLHAPVGSFQANDFGLHDMAGNVWEWCAGFELTSQYDLDHRETGPRFGEEPFANAPIRGGSFMDRAAAARIRSRRSFARTSNAGNIGLRPSRRLDQPRE